MPSESKQLGAALRTEVWFVHVRTPSVVLNRTVRLPGSTTALKNEKMKFDRINTIHRISTGM